MIDPIDQQYHSQSYQHKMNKHQHDKSSSYQYLLLRQHQECIDHLHKKQQFQCRQVRRVTLKVISKFQIIVLQYASNTKKAILVIVNNVEIIVNPSSRKNLCCHLRVLVDRRIPICFVVLVSNHTTLSVLQCRHEGDEEEYELVLRR